MFSAHSAIKKALVIYLKEAYVIDLFRNQEISTVTGFYSDTLAKNDRVPQK